MQHIENKTFDKSVLNLSFFKLKNKKLYKLKS